MLGKNFKKLLALLLALVMAFSLFACNAPEGSGDGDGDGEGSGQEGGGQQGGGNLEGIDPDSMTAKEYMMLVEGESIQGAVGVLTEVLKAIDGADLSNVTTDMGANLELTVRPSAQLVQLLQSSLFPQGGGIDLSALQSIGLNTSMDMKDDLIRMLVGVSVNGQKLADADLIADMAAMTIWLGLPGLAEGYVEFDANSMGGAMEDVPVAENSKVPMAGSFSGTAVMQPEQGIAMAPAAIVQLLPKFMPDPEKLEPLLNKYIGIILGSIGDVKSEKIQAELDGNKQDAIKLTYTITEQDLAKMILAVLKAAKDDAELKIVIDELSADLRVVAAELGETFDQDLWPMFKSFCENGVAYFESYANGDVAAANSGNKIIITTTLDSSNNVIGRSFAMYTNNQPDMEFEYLAVTAANSTNFTLTAKEYGQGGMSHGFAFMGHSDATGASCNFFVLENNAKYKLVEFDFDSGASKATIKPTAELYRMIFGGAVEMDMALELSVKEETVTIELVMDGQMLIGIDLKASEKTTGNVQRPTDVVDMENFNQWITADAIQQVLDNWKAAGMPEIVLPE